MPPSPFAGGAGVSSRRARLRRAAAGAVFLGIAALAWGCETHVVHQDNVGQVTFASPDGGTQSTPPDAPKPPMQLPPIIAVPFAWIGNGFRIVFGAFIPPSQPATPQSTMGYTGDAVRYGPNGDITKLHYENGQIEGSQVQSSSSNSSDDNSNSGK